jgi:2-dehydro-3-deoxygluconokinase
MKVVSFGEIMLRLKTPGSERFFQSPVLEATFGGAESNVAVALARLGMNAEFVTALPTGPIGEACLRELRYQGVDVSHIVRKPGRMGIYFLENGANQRPSNVVYDRAHSAFADMAAGDIDWNAALEGAGWFHVSGISPAVSANCAEETLSAAKAARKNGILVSVDLNYRAKLWKYGVRPDEFMTKLAALADVLIGNEEDYQKSLGISGPKDVGSGSIDLEGYSSMSRAVLAAYPSARHVAVTLRNSFSADHNDWSAMLTSRKETIVSKTYRITDIVDRVGAGDSFSAGLIFGLASGYDDVKALEFAVAASCLKHSISGDFALFDFAEVSKLAGGDASGRVQR